MISSENRKTTFRDHATRADITDVRAQKRTPEGVRKLNSTANVVLFEQSLVTRLVLALDVIEQRTARRDHFQQAAA